MKNKGTKILSIINGSIHLLYKICLYFKFLTSCMKNICQNFVYILYIKFRKKVLGDIPTGSGRG